MPSHAAACLPRADGYVRRRPEETVLYQVVREHWPALRARAEEAGGLPKLVVRDFEEYLRCGLLEHGLCHLACARCGHSMLVAFSCKRRGFCPSCCGRRMADLAAHLVDDVLPAVPLRQWVCSLPWSVRTALAYDRSLCSDVLAAFARALERSYRRRAKRALALASTASALFGAITVIQRSDSALRVDPHFHTLALDGVYVRDPEGALVFHDLGPPCPSDVADVARWTHAGLARALARRGRTFEEPADEAFASEQPVLDSLARASALDIQSLGRAPGQKTAKLVAPVRLVPSARALVADHAGVNVHAERALDGRDRAQLERLCRYSRDRRSRSSASSSTATGG